MNLDWLVFRTGAYGSRNKRMPLIMKIVIIALVVALIVPVSLLLFRASTLRMYDDIPRRPPVRGTNTNLTVIEFDDRLFTIWSSSDRSIEPGIVNRTGSRFIAARTLDGTGLTGIVRISNMENFTQADRPGAVAFQDSLYVFWSEDKNISFARYRSGSWDPPARLNASIGYPVYYIEPAVFNDTIFLMVKMENGPRGNPLGYLTFDGASASALEMVQENIQIREPLEATVFNGSLFVFWGDFALPGMLRYDGTAWSTFLTPCNNPFPESSTYEHPSAAVHDGRLYVAWIRITNGSDVRELVITSYDGTGWAVPEHLAPPETRWHWVGDVSLAVLGTGLYVCWVMYDVTDQPAVGYLLWSEHRPAGWTSESNVGRPLRGGYFGPMISLSFQDQLFVFSSFDYRRFDGLSWTETFSILPMP